MSKVSLNLARVPLARFSCIYLLSNLLFCLALVLTFVATPEAAQAPAAPTQLSIGSGTAPVTGTGGTGIIATDSAPNVTPSSNTSGLVAHWKFDEGTGTTVTDSSGNNNHGTLVNGPVWTSGIAGNALYFDGIDDSVTVPASKSLDLANSFTLSAWVNPTASKADFTAVMARNTVSDHVYFLYATSWPGYCGGTGFPLAGANITGHQKVICSTSGLPLNRWSYLTFSYDGSNFKLYVNGSLSQTLPYTGPVDPGTGTFQIGASYFGEYFNGFIDEVRIYNRALNDTEVQAIYQQDAPATSQTVLATSDSFSFSLANSGDQSLNAGSSVTNTINASLLSGSSHQISFSVSGLPSGATASFSQNACNPACSSVLNLATTVGMSPGTFPITITASGGGMNKTTTFMLTVFLTATSTVSSGSSSAGTASFYVAKHGNDAYTCSQAANPATPKLTIGAALDCAGAGGYGAGQGANKVVEVAAGTYNETFNRGFNWPKGSSWNAPFTLRAKAGDTVWILPSKPGDQIMYLHDGDNNLSFYIIIDGIGIDARNQSQSSTVTTLAFVGNHMRFKNMRFTNNVGGAVWGRGNNVEFINNHVDSGPFGVWGEPAVAGGEFAYPYYISGTGILFDGNLIEDFPTFGIHYYYYFGCPSGAIFRNNIIRNFGWGKDCPASGDPRCLGRGPDNRGSGILTCGTNHQVYNNLVYNGNDAINLYTGGNNRAYNNTIYNMTHRGISSNNPNGNIIRDNIVYSPTAPRDGNIFSWQNPDTTAYSNNLCGQSGGGCSLGVNPLFADAANGNFNLQSGSPAAGIGAALP